MQVTEEASTNVFENDMLTVLLLKREDMISDISKFSRHLSSISTSIFISGVFNA